MQHCIAITTHSARGTARGTARALPCALRVWCCAPQGGRPRQPLDSELAGEERALWIARPSRRLAVPARAPEADRSARALNAWHTHAMPNNLMIGKNAPGASIVTASSAARAGAIRADNADASRMVINSGSARLVMALTHVARVLGVFVSFSMMSAPRLAEDDAATANNAILAHIPVPLCVCLYMLAAASVLLAMQMPWKGRKIGTPRLKRLVLNALGYLACHLAWMFGLKRCGPMRAFLMEGAELPMLYVYATLSGKEKPSRMKTRGALLILMAYVLIMYDASGEAKTPAVVTKAEHGFLEKTHLGIEKLQHVMHDMNSRAPEDNPFHRPAAAADDENLQNRKHRFRADVYSRRHLLAEEVFSIDTQLASSHAGFAEGRRHLLSAEQINQGEEAEDAERVEEGNFSAQNISRARDSNGSRLDPEKKSLSRREMEAIISSTKDTVGIRGEIGVLLILLSSMLTQLFREENRKLATEVGGAKRYYSMMVTCAAFLSCPIGLLACFFTKSWLQPGDIMHAVGGSTFIGFFYVVIPFYVRSLVSTALGQRSLLKMSMVIPFLIAGIFSAFYNGIEPGGFSLWLLSAFALDIAGMMYMTNSSRPVKAYELPTHLGDA
ncbi:hypothetical protein FVE85_0289 [Porphyridium purpureum]|uniref:EamA domain-containing protein n=1 Tax=Porphyridium purpureum TaxID=35688 RepID=A0A5J4YZW7_PORPP|nr:hypothetical protein FVE85_0289 [Porphyridium purpureum]|eukprot:POR6465..scf208_2